MKPIEEDQEQEAEEQNHKGTSPIRQETPPKKQEEDYYPLPDNQNGS